MYFPKHCISHNTKEIYTKLASDDELILFKKSQSVVIGRTEEKEEKPMVEPTRCPIMMNKSSTRKPKASVPLPSEQECFSLGSNLPCHSFPSPSPKIAFTFRY
jgi:hypothetical protein